MLPVPAYRPEKYPPSDQFAQFDDAVGEGVDAAAEAHSRLGGKRERMMHFHHQRLERHGIVPVRNAGVQTERPPHTEMATGPDEGHSDQGHQFLDSVAGGAAAGARFGGRVGRVTQGLGQMAGFVGSAFATSLATGVGGAVVGVGQGALNHMIHGTPSAPPEDDPYVPQSAASSSSPADVEGTATPVEPAYLLDRDSAPKRKPMGFLEKNQHRIADKFQAEGEHPLYPGKQFTGSKWVRQ